ncbi:hypothetical protein D0O09_16765 [Pseudomonas putida]|nr:hypothetical protein D0O09_16765 [Pseudomonas putida]
MLNGRLPTAERPLWVDSGLSRKAAFDPERTLIQSSFVSAGLIAGKPAPTGTSPAFRHALYLWEPRLPAMVAKRPRLQMFALGRNQPFTTGN